MRTGLAGILKSIEETRGQLLLFPGFQYISRNLLADRSSFCKLKTVYEA